MNRSVNAYSAKKGNQYFVVDNKNNTLNLKDDYQKFFEKLSFSTLERVLTINSLECNAAEQTLTLPADKFLGVRFDVKNDQNIIFKDYPMFKAVLYKYKDKYGLIYFNRDTTKLIVKAEFDKIEVPDSEAPMFKLFGRSYAKLEKITGYKNNIAYKFDEYGNISKRT